MNFSAAAKHLSNPTAKGSPPKKSKTDKSIISNLGLNKIESPTAVRRANTSYNHVYIKAFRVMAHEEFPKAGGTAFFLEDATNPNKGVYLDKLMLDSIRAASDWCTDLFFDDRYKYLFRNNAPVLNDRGYNVRLHIMNILNPTVAQCRTIFEYIATCLNELPENENTRVSVPKDFLHADAVWYDCLGETQTMTYFTQRFPTPQNSDEDTRGDRRAALSFFIQGQFPPNAIHIMDIPREWLAPQTVIDVDADENGDNNNENNEVANENNNNNQENHSDNDETENE